MQRVYVSSICPLTLTYYCTGSCHVRRIWWRKYIQTYNKNTHQLRGKLRVMIGQLIDRGHIPVQVRPHSILQCTNNHNSRVLPDGKEAARKLKVQVARFILIKDVLYKRGFSRPYLRCLGTEEAIYVMREVHEGICGNHFGSRALAHKLVWAGYYWPTMQKDAEAYVRACDKCQRFSNIIRQPTEELTPLTAP